MASAITEQYISSGNMAYAEWRSGAKRRISLFFTVPMRAL